MNLKIGLTEKKPGWQIVLGQEGIPTEIISCSNEVKPDDVSALIVGKFDNLQQKENILKYVRSGGAVLVDSTMSSELLNIRTKRQKIRYLTPDRSSTYSEVGFVNLDLNGELPQSKDMIPIDNGLKICIIRIGKGIVLILPFDVNEAILDHTSVRRKFYFKRKELPSERVARVSKGEIRKIVRVSLEYLHHFRKIPFIQLWYYPNGQRNMFAFRVDVDFCNKNDVEALYKTCKNNNIPASWFIETKSSEEWIQYFKKMKNQEIGLHCYRHRIFNDYQTNRDNIEKGMKILEKSGINPVGFVSPYGEWNDNLGKALVDLGFQYSSEFCLDYDDLPFYPYFQYIGEVSRENRFSNVMQIPIHPISIGRLRRSHFTDEEMWDYYKGLILQKMKLNEPIIIYHHPSHIPIYWDDFFDKLFRFINDRFIWKPNLSEFHSWWQKRYRIKFSAEIQGDKIKIDNNIYSDDIWLRISSARYGISITKLKSEIYLKNLEWQSEKERITLPNDIVRIRRFSWRDLLYDYENLRGKLRQ